MTIKKLKTAPKAPAGGEVADMPAAGQKTGAAIANRLRLDAPDPAALAAATASKKATQCALTAALVALAVAGLLTYILYAHWDFLMPV